MTSTPFRLAIIAAFALAVLSGPALAYCSGGQEQGCCCTKDRSCPRPVTSEARSLACCKSSTPAPPPPQGSQDRIAGPSLDLASMDTPQAAVERPRPTVSFGADPAAAQAFAGIGLYTLHAAFLI